MTLEEFAKKRWRHSEIIEYSYKDIVVECMLLSIDFTEGLFRLQAFDSGLYDDEPFWARVENCKRPYHKLKKVNQSNKKGQE